MVHRMSFCAASNSAITRVISAGLNFSAWIRNWSYASSGTSSRSCWPGAVLTRSRFRKWAKRLVGDVANVLTIGDQPSDDLERAAGVAYRDRIGELVLDLTAGRAQQGVHDVVIDLVPAQHASLVEQGERVARGPFGLPSDRVGRRLRERGALGLGDRLQLPGEGLQPEPTEVEALRPADDRGRHLERFGGGQHEPHAGRRFLEDLQQGVERLAGEPLRLVDDVDLLAALHRRGGRLLAQFARVLHPAVAGGVDLDDVEVRAFTDRDALGTHAARLGRGPLLAVDHLGQDASGGGLTRPPGPAEQERVVQAPLADGAGQRADHVVLPQDLLGGLRPVPPVQGLVLYLVRHSRLHGHGPPTRTPG